MKARKTDKRTIFTHKKYCSKPHKRKKKWNEAATTHQVPHTVLNSTIDQESERAIGYWNIYKELLDTKQIKELLDTKQIAFKQREEKSVRIKGKLIINTYSKRGKVTTCCWTAMYNNVERRAHALTVHAQETRDCYLALAYIHIRTQFWLIYSFFGLLHFRLHREMILLNE